MKTISAMLAITAAAICGCGIMESAVWEGKAIVTDNPPDSSAGRDRAAIELPIHLDGAMLTLKIGYGGGCQKHQIAAYGLRNAYGPGEPTDSLPRRHLFITHRSNGDACEAYILNEVKVDLTPLLQEYRRQGLGNRIRLILMEPNGKNFTEATAIAITL